MAHVLPRDGARQEDRHVSLAVVEDDADDPPYCPELCKQCTLSSGPGTEPLLLHVPPAYAPLDRSAAGTGL